MDSARIVKIAYNDLIEIAVTVDNVRNALYTVTSVLDDIAERESEFDPQAVRGVVEILNDQRAKLDNVRANISEIEPEK